MDSSQKLDGKDHTRVPAVILLTPVDAENPLTIPKIRHIHIAAQCKTERDRPGLLSRIARVLTAYDINLQTAKINTLGARAEDVFLIAGAALRDAKTVVRLESGLVEQLRT